MSEAKRFDLPLREYICIRVQMQEFSHEEAIPVCIYLPRGSCQNQPGMRKRATSAGGTS